MKHLLPTLILSAMLTACAAVGPSAGEHGDAAPCGKRLHQEGDMCPLHGKNPQRGDCCGSKPALP